MKQHFLLRDDITFLNFGSFGACAKPVFERYQKYQLELEQEPVDFITVNGPKYLQESKIALAEYINANVEDLIGTLDVRLHSLTIASFVSFTSTTQIIFH